MDKILKKNALPLFILIFASMMLCNLGWAKEETPHYWPTDGWKASDPESQGMDSGILVNMLAMILKKDILIDSVLVIRNGTIVLDAYSFPRNSDRKHNIFSCSKSVTSTLVGIAIDKGFIKDVNQPVLDFFPKLVPKNLDANKKALTLEHLLTMTAGLECRDSQQYQYRGLMRMRESPNWVRYMLDLPIVQAPGTRFEYCNGATFLLSAILQEQTGRNALIFAKNYLFSPLGISDVTWPSNPQGKTLGYGRIYMRPRDMAKIGYLYLKNGIWDDKQIVSSQWVKTATRKHVSTTRTLPGYGYQWWTADQGIYMAVGRQGQFIFVVPEKDMVAVFTSSLSLEDFYIPLVLLHSHIILAAKSPTSLPENPAKKKELKSLVALWQQTTPWERKKIIKK